MIMKLDNFSLFSTLLKQRTGYSLAHEKSYFLEARLLPVVRKWNLHSIDDLAIALHTKPNENMVVDFLDCVTKIESVFFQDKSPFDLFQKTLLPELLATRGTKKNIRIWSAAASSGQEAYSLAMVCSEEYSRLQACNVEIIGTDLSKEMVARAKNGIYSQLEVQRGLPVAFLLKYFFHHADKWQIHEKIRHMVKFFESNLISESQTHGVFDVIFCRDVLRYLDLDIQKRVLETLKKSLAPNGALIIGRSESIVGIANFFKLASPDHEYYIHPQSGGFKR